MKILEGVEQGSQEWLQARIAKITGSKLGKIRGTPAARKKFIYELIAEELTGTFAETYQSPSMERGNTEEPFAVKEYEKRTGLKAEKVGFILGDDGFTGLSPDRLIRKGKLFVGGLEIKNPDSSTQIEYLISKKIPSCYMDQILHYFLIIPSLEWVDFASFDARIQMDSLRMHLVRITREELKGEIEAAQNELIAFRKEWMDIMEQLTF